MSPRRRLDLPVAALALVTSAAVGAAATAAVLSPFAPASVSAAQTPAELPVTAQSFLDARAVSITADLGAARPVTVPVAGTVTALSCTVGRPLTSGSSPVAVDGVPLVALATTVPLWRDLAKGASGADVTAVQQALVALHQPLAKPYGTVTTQTLTAWQHVLSAAGVRSTQPAQKIQRSQVVWLPDAAAPVLTCPLALGADVAPGASLATVSPQLNAARLVSMPSPLAPGARVLRVGGLAVHVDASGAITDRRELTALSRSTAVTAATDPHAITASLELAAPSKVAVVPPSAVVGPDATHTCVVSHNQAIRVAVLGSQLGESYVTFGDNPPTSVVVDPPRATPCS